MIKTKVVLKITALSHNGLKMNITIVNAKEGNKLEKQVFHFVYSCISFAFLKQCILFLHQDAETEQKNQVDCFIRVDFLINKDSRSYAGCFLSQASPFPTIF